MMIDPSKFLTAEQNATRVKLAERKVESEDDVISLFQEGNETFVGVLDAQLKTEVVIQQANPAALAEYKIRLTLPKWFHDHVPEESQQYLLDNILLNKNQYPNYTDEDIRRIKDMLVFA
jgi:hypothetical protein